MWQQLLPKLQQGDFKSLARCISLVENEHEGTYVLLSGLPPSSTKIIGITGPPGAGKSTLTDALIHEMVSKSKRVGVICVDPSSPFNMGALLGDRIRMSQWYQHPNVFIRSLATRGSLGGLNPKIIEITDVMKAAPFDAIIVETVGVGQSEIEIAGLADVTVVVIVPEAGDEVQTMKAGLMEIADIFVVNKADRPGADQFVHNLKQIAKPSTEHGQLPVLKTIASQKTGTAELWQAIEDFGKQHNKKKAMLLAEKAYHLIQHRRMKDVNKHELKNLIEQEGQDSFNLYRFVEQHN